MDTSAADIRFNADGICSYCMEFAERTSRGEHANEHDKQCRLDALVARVKRVGRGKRYDCIVGVSGGVDSSWVLVKTIELGLRPLAVHMDNGWNSELAQSNIANLVTTLGVDLHTHVIDWTEYRSLMQAFFDADVLDVELLYDNAMLAVNYQAAVQHGVRYILSGDNVSTEGMRMPPGWNWLKFDRRNIEGLARRHGMRGLSTFPAVGTLGFFYYRYLRRIDWVSFLDLTNYNKFNALAALESKYSYKRYPYKHYESIFTRFYQGYLLPRKFDVDKRRLHLSTLIITGQLSREEALSQLAGIPYLSEQDQEGDRQYFLKKMGWKPEDLETYLKRPQKAHTDYPSEKKLWDFAKRMHQLIAGQ
jgi:N-acetyl sugar amidotransferase